MSATGRGLGLCTYRHGRTNSRTGPADPSAVGPIILETRIFMFTLVGCVAQLAERRSLAGELTLSCARPAADG